ncbi:MAG: hypothetical protein FJZ59_00635 [Chlamydiae bacterium]|nr:hypothetical protein [Chlamydiota bacterium]
MNFTREPIVETIISAKEGYKLSIKSSKHINEEEYLVDAVEVVSFSGALFYRSGEKPKSFFIPIHDYEIQEVREARLTIRSPVMEKSIKIGGGKEASKSQKPEADEKTLAAVDEVNEKPASQEKEQSQNIERNKREKKNKFRRKRNFEESAREAVQREVQAAEESGKPVQLQTESVFSHLLKPPESLISDSIHKYKKLEEESVMSPEVSEALTEHPAADFVPAMIKQDDVQFFSEAPKEYEKLEEEIVPTEVLIFSPTDLEKPEE